ncbi:MAG: hypothetical protein AB1664_12420 [Thermodesulfobacteriota bacterium]
MQVSLERAGQLIEEAVKTELGVKRGKDLDTFRMNLLKMINAGEIKIDGGLLRIDPQCLNSQVGDLRKWLKNNGEVPTP